jgi:hypothetical protein
MMPQIQPILAFAILSCTALAGAVLSTTALFVSVRQQRAAYRRAEAIWAAHQAEWEAAVAGLTQRVDSLAAELRDFGQQAPQVRNASGPAAKSSLNLTKRAQALRMHRRGDAPEQIAALLEIPFQEVDLLLKVQRIVLSSI